MLGDSMRRFADRFALPRLFVTAAAFLALMGAVWSSNARAEPSHDWGAHNRYDSRDEWRSSSDMDWLWEPDRSYGGRRRSRSHGRSWRKNSPSHLRKKHSGRHSRARSARKHEKRLKSERRGPNRVKPGHRKKEEAKRKDAAQKAAKAERPPVIKEPRRKETAPGTARPVEAAREPSQDYRPEKDIPKSKPKPPPAVPAEPVAAVPQKAGPAAQTEQALKPGAYPVHVSEKDEPAPESARSVAREVLTLIRSSLDASVEAELAEAHRLERVASDNVPLLNARMQIYRIKDRRTIKQTIAELVTDRRVMTVQPNYIYRHQGAAEGAVPPENPKYDRAKLHLGAAHRLAKGKGVLVAVIDSAIDMTHPDLAGAISDAFDAADDGKDDENDTHGTAVAGVIRGAGRVAPGVAPEAKILSVRAFAARTPGKRPEATTRALIRGVQWAIDRGARVLNMSFSGPEDPAFQSILAIARIHKAVAVAAAGNGGPAADPVYPAAYPEVIAVTALDRNDHVYESANHGRYVTVAAPGVEILAPSKRRGYEYYTGSSFAAAQVSGVIALMLEKKKDLDPAGVRAALTHSAESLGPDADGNAATGAGRVNAAAALKAVDEEP
jgi:subtilisin family serine protease